VLAGRRPLIPTAHDYLLTHDISGTGDESSSFLTSRGLLDADVVIEILKPQVITTSSQVAGMFTVCAQAYRPPEDSITLFEIVPKIMNAFANRQRYANALNDGVDGSRLEFLEEQVGLRHFQWSEHLTAVIHCVQAGAEEETVKRLGTWKHMSAVTYGSTV